MSYYRENRKRAITFNKEPTMTDQAGAHDTDINVIVSKFAISGRVPGTQQPPMGGDFTNLPTDLRGFIHEAWQLESRRAALPEKLRDLPVETLLALTPTELTSILAPPAPQPAKTEEKK